MRHVGFSTGALARQDVDRALSMLERRGITAVELSALRPQELLPLVERLDDLDLEKFEFVSFHAPSSIAPDYEPIAIEALKRVLDHGWPIIVHPDAITQYQNWAIFGDSLCIENMDKRKPIGQSAADLAHIFSELPDASLCLDLGHARQIDPTMSEATAIISRFRNRLLQLHVSEVNAESRHDPLTREAVMAFSKVAHLLPRDIPIILESRISEEDIETEIRIAEFALGVPDVVAAVGD